MLCFGASCNNNNNNNFKTNFLNHDKLCLPEGHYEIIYYLENTIDNTMVQP